MRYSSPDWTRPGSSRPFEEWASTMSVADDRRNVDIEEALYVKGNRQQRITQTPSRLTRRYRRWCLDMEMDPTLDALVEASREASGGTFLCWW